MKIGVFRYRNAQTDTPFHQVLVGRPQCRIGQCHQIVSRFDKSSCCLRSKQNAGNAARKKSTVLGKTVVEGMRIFVRTGVVARRTEGQGRAAVRLHLHHAQLHKYLYHPKSCRGFEGCVMISLKDLHMRFFLADASKRQGRQHAKAFL